jgi:hypothetical protein
MLVLMMAIAFLGYAEHGQKWIFLYVFNIGNIDFNNVLYLSLSTPVITSQRLQQFLEKHKIKPRIFLINLSFSILRKLEALFFCRDYLIN